jgi:hypothetical protein
VDRQKNLPLRCLDHPAFTAADLPRDRVTQGIARNIVRRNEALSAARNLGHDNRRTPCRARGIKSCENL